jgi:hypothetical protein
MEDTKLSWPIFQPTTEIEAAGPIKVEGIVTEVLKAEEGAVGEIIDTQQDVTAIASEVKPAPRTVSGRHQSRILETFVYVVLAIGASMFLCEYM